MVRYFALESTGLKKCAIAKQDVEEAEMDGVFAGTRSMRSLCIGIGYFILYWLQDNSMISAVKQAFKEKEEKAPVH